jgi:hypothetical protein
LSHRSIRFIRLPILAILLKQTITLPFGKPTSIQNRQQDAESRKILFARINRFDQPIKTWHKTFLKLFSTKVQGRGTNFKQYKTESTDKSQTQLTVFAIAFDSSHKEAKNL